MISVQKSKNIATIILAIIVAIAGLRLLSLGFYPLFDPTEGRYAEIGRKMFETGNFITPFIEYNVPFWAKPPLSFWLTAISYKIFGINEFAARLPSLISMGGVLWLVWGFKNQELRRLASQEKPVTCDSNITILILSSMGLFFYLAGGVMTDPVLAFGITLTMVAFWRSVVLGQKLWGYAFFVGIAIAMLAKGPIGVVLMGIPIFIWVLCENKWKDLWRHLPWVYGTLITLVVVLPWYIMAEIRTPGFLHYFIIGEHFERFLVKGWKGDLYGSGRAHVVGTIWLFGIVAMLPWSLLLLAAPFVKFMRKSLAIPSVFNNNWQLYLWLWALTPLVFFTIARNVLVTYVISALPAFALLLTPLVVILLQKKFGKIVVLTMSCIVPVVFIAALFLVNLMPDSKWIRSEDQVIRIYKDLTKDKNVPLLYFGKHSYSEDFYLREKDIEITDINDVRPYLDREVFVVVSRGTYRQIPADLQKKLAIVTEKNDSVLLHNIP